MPTYANQRRVITHKSKLDGQFGQYPLDALQLACRNLNKGALVLWLDFAKNADEYSVDLSPAAIKKMYGSAEKTTQRAIEELEEQHYLVKNPNDSYKYDFLGIILRYIGVPITFKNKYVCSYFVAELLSVSVRS